MRWGWIDLLASILMMTRSAGAARARHPGAAAPAPRVFAAFSRTGARTARRVGCGHLHRPRDLRPLAMLNVESDASSNIKTPGGARWSFATITTVTAIAIP
jgi:hypothetical protein